MACFIAAVGLRQALNEWACLKPFCSKPSSCSGIYPPVCGRGFAGGGVQHSCMYEGGVAPGRDTLIAVRFVPPGARSMRPFCGMPSADRQLLLVVVFAGRESEAHSSELQSHV